MANTLIFQFLQQTFGLILPFSVIMGCFFQKRKKNLRMINYKICMPISFRALLLIKKSDMIRNHQVRSKITIIFMSLGACTYNFEIFFLHYCVKACPCVYQTILTIKYTGPIYCLNPMRSNFVGPQTLFAWDLHS